MKIRLEGSSSLKITTSVRESAVDSLSEHDRRDLAGGGGLLTD
jgi:hypothetical protein